MDEAPTKAIAGVTPGWQRLRIVDATSGEVLDRVKEADVAAGTVTRTAVDADGNLKRDGDRFVVETERRAIRIEWIEPEKPIVPVDDAGPLPPPTPAVDPVTGLASASLPNTPTQPVIG